MVVSRSKGSDEGGYQSQRGTRFTDPGLFSSSPPRSLYSSSSLLVRNTRSSHTTLRRRRGPLSPTVWSILIKVYNPPTGHDHLITPLRAGFFHMTHSARPRRKETSCVTRSPNKSTPYSTMVTTTRPWLARSNPREFVLGLYRTLSPRGPLISLPPQCRRN